MTKQEFEDLCAQSGLAETNSASVSIEYRENDTVVEITVTHKVVPIEPCSAYHPLTDDDSLRRSVDLFSQFITLTAEITSYPA